MPTKTDQTASFMVRFTQNIYEENGEAQIQWRGSISHVQGDDKVNFSNFNDAMAFMQQKLTHLTKEATQDKSPEEREGILSKSFNIWKRVAQTGPKMIIDTIKDPKKQVSQIQEQISYIGDEISHKVGIDDWRMASKSDFKKMIQTLENLSEDVQQLHQKVDTLSKKKSTKK